MEEIAGTQKPVMVKEPREREVCLYPGVYLTFLTANMREWQGKLRIVETEIDKHRRKCLESQQVKS